MSQARTNACDVASDVAAWQGNEDRHLRGPLDPGRDAIHPLAISRLYPGLHQAPVQGRRPIRSLSSTHMTEALQVARMW